MDNLISLQTEEQHGRRIAKKLGGSGSGHFEHEGRPGEVGGSGPGGGNIPSMGDKTLNKIYQTTDGNKRFRIIKHMNKFISKRNISFKTSFGPSSTGTEIQYDSEDEAFKAEYNWLNKKS